MIEYSSIDQDTMGRLLRESVDHSLANGNVTRTAVSSEGVGFLANVCPTTLFPSPFPRDSFHLGCHLQEHFDILYHRVAHDRDFLERCISGCIEVDDFAKHLWDIYERVEAAGVKQPMSLSITRSDYMVPQPKSGEETHGEITGQTALLKQIEFNTIAASMGNLAVRCRDMHRHILGRLGSMKHHEDNLPENCVGDHMVSGLVEAWKVYGNNKAAILFSVEETETNFADIRRIQYGLFDKDSNIPVVLKSFTHITVDAEGIAWCDGKEIAVVYYRNGYSPATYTSQSVWDARLAVELSQAIKCPAIHSQLAGMKKVQQELAKEGVLEQFISDPGIVQQIRSTFVGLHALEGESGTQAMINARANPEQYVLKPNREGGGNNYYGDDIAPQLDAIVELGEEAAFILMERIFPVENENVMICPRSPMVSLPVEKMDKVVPSDGRVNCCQPGPGGSVREPCCDLSSCCKLLPSLVSEFGVYGVLLGSRDVIQLNLSGGHLLRTKSKHTNEGGVHAGASCIDSPYLV